MAPQTLPGTPRPEGIEPRHFAGDRSFRRQASLLSLGILAAVLAWGLSGYAGDRHAQYSIDNEAGHFELNVPDIVRCGSVIETRIRVVAKQRIAKLVIAVDAPLWRQITTNSILPAASSEASENGRHRFSYDPVAAGQSFDLQIQQQVNPKLFGINRGTIAIMDGDRPLAEVALGIKVLP